MGIKPQFHTLSPKFCSTSLCLKPLAPEVCGSETHPFFLWGLCTYLFLIPVTVIWFLYVSLVLFFRSCSVWIHFIFFAFSYLLHIRTCVYVCVWHCACILQCVCEPASSFHQVCPDKFLHPFALTELPRPGVCRCDRACAIRQCYCFHLIGDKRRLENWCKWRSQSWEEVGFHRWAGRKWGCTFIGKQRGLNWLLSQLLLFQGSRSFTPGMCCPIQDGISHLSERNLETPLQTDLGLCHLGDSMRYQSAMSSATVSKGVGFTVALPSKAYPCSLFWSAWVKSLSFF